MVIVDKDYKQTVRVEWNLETRDIDPKGDPSFNNSYGDDGSGHESFGQEFVKGHVAMESSMFRHRLLTGESFPTSAGEFEDGSIITISPFVVRSTRDDVMGRGENTHISIQQERIAEGMDGLETVMHNEQPGKRAIAWFSKEKLSNGAPKRVFVGWRWFNWIQFSASKDPLYDDLGNGPYPSRMDWFDPFGVKLRSGNLGKFTVQQCGWDFAERHIRELDPEDPKGRKTKIKANLDDGEYYRFVDPEYIQAQECLAPDHTCVHFQGLSISNGTGPYTRWNQTPGHYAGYCAPSENWSLLQRQTKEIRNGNLKRAEKEAAKRRKLIKNKKKDN